MQLNVSHKGCEMFHKDDLGANFFRVNGGLVHAQTSSVFRGGDDKKRWFGARGCISALDHGAGTPRELAAEDGRATQRRRPRPRVTAPSPPAEYSDTPYAKGVRH